MKGRLARSGAALIAGVLLGAVGLAVSRAEAASLPADPDAHGYIGLCDGQGRNVTSGWVDATPFVWKAVGSQAAPSQMRGVGQNATLRIYQPRPDAEPAYWSGDALSAQSYYKGSIPAAQFTRKDIPLSVIVKEYPPEVDGMYQLRLYYNTPQQGSDPSDYAATTIQVSGNAWHVVSGGQVNCAAAKSVSQEALIGAAKGKATQPPPPPKSTPPSGGDATSNSGSGSGSSTDGARGPNGSGSGSNDSSGASAAPASNGTSASDGSAADAATGASTSAAADESHSSGASGLVWVFGVIALALVLGAAGGYVYRRHGRGADRS